MIQNINIARVSLITHGPVSALRTLHGVYIPRDVRVAGGISRMRRKRDGTGKKRPGRTAEGEGRACLCAFKGSRTHCGLLPGPRITLEAACVPLGAGLNAARNFYPGKTSPPFGAIMRRHNSSKIL